ncbi:MAG: PEP-CTERM sorting domain-containing protein [Opitutales bacterium]|nr:PEP-CTERM sorting domain-containing protein [Opitutales bacterium]
MKKIVKTFSITILLALPAGMIHGQVQTMLIDFGTNAGVPNSPDGNGNHWNSGITGTDSVQLQDTAGNNNVATATLSGTFRTSDNEEGWTDRSEVPSWASGSVSEALDDRLFQGNNQSGTLTLSGLNTALTYDIELAAAFQAPAGNAGEDPGFVSLTAGGGLNPVTPVNARANPNDNSDLIFNSTQNAYEWTVRTGGDTELQGGGSSGADLSPNNEGWIGWYGISPDSNGDISITFSAIGGESRGAWNAMSITAIPEPSTYAALFGLGALGMILLRRKLRK